MGRPYVRRIDASTTNQVGNPTLLLDDFEDSLVKWREEDSGGAGWTVARSTAAAFSGGACFSIAAAAMGAGTYMQQTRRIYAPRVPVFRITCMMRFGDGGSNAAQYIGFEYDDGDTKRSIHLGINPATELLQRITTPDGASAQVASLGDLGDDLWFELGWTVDLTNNVINQLRCGSLDIKPDSTALDSAASSGVNDVRVNIGIIPAAATTDTFLFDNVLLTET